MIGYCTTCQNTACPTPKVRNKADGNCSYWTDRKLIAEVSEHDTCSQCDAVISIDDGCYPLKCQWCEFELEGL